MLGIKKRYFALIGLAASGWAASHFVSIRGLEGIRLVAKPSPLVQENPDAGDLDDETAGAAWQAVPLSFGNANRSVSTYNSFRVLPNKIWSESDSVPFPTAQPPISNYASDDTSKELETRLRTTTSTPKIRIASFNLNAFNEDKLQKRPVVETLVRIIRQFDVVAMQHISSKQTDLLPILTDRVNRSDRRYDFLIGPPVGRDQKQQFAFLFDTERIETDRGQLYTVDDPQDLLTYEPLVAWFRTTIPNREQSFTFSAVNLRLNPLAGDAELRLMPDLLRGVRNDGRLEDDVVLMGEFMASGEQIARVPGLDMLITIEGVPTSIAGDAMTGNILIPTRATDEFTGKAGVVDFLRQLNLSFDQASQVSSAMPIWAEFTAYEGGKP